MKWGKESVLCTGRHLQHEEAEQRARGRQVMRENPIMFFARRGEARPRGQTRYVEGAGVATWDCPAQCLRSLNEKTSLVLSVTGGKTSERMMLLIAGPCGIQRCFV